MLVAALALALALGLAAQARADAFGDTFTDYKAHGKIDPCKFSEQTLKQAKQQVPPDIEQYAPDFPAELDRALQNRTLGACGGAAGSGAGGDPVSPGGSSAGAPPTDPAGGAPAGGGAAGGPNATPAPPPIANAAGGIPQATRFRNTSASHTPVPLLIIGVLALLIVVPALAFHGTRWLGWEPRWIPGLRYSVGEAGYRAGGTWSEFADWLRLGR
ncbi:MAG: hypothetical protein E6G56_09115 [Actinobacteria bacterium]|nr:MAG: hypothetical protein E6G56_09115 [Actinomycetota bacterium]